MEKRIFIAVLVSIALLWGWAVLAPKLFPDLMKKPAPAKTAPIAPKQPATSPKPQTAPPPSRSELFPKLPPTSSTQVQLIRIERPAFVATFSNRGAQLVSFKLTNYKQDGQPVELVKARDPNRTDFPFEIESSSAAVTRRLNGALYEVHHVADHGQDNVQFVYKSADGLTVEKRFVFRADPLFDFSVGVSPPVPYRVAIGPGLRTLGADEKDSQFTITGNGVVQREDNLKIIRRDKSPSLEVFDSVQFIGIEDNYFLSILQPSAKSGSALIRSVDFGTGKDKRREIYAAVNATPDGAVMGGAFFGPKETSLLDKYGFDKTLQYGTFGVIARWFLVALVWINKFTHNYGWAIVVLTIVIKIVLYPLQHKWMLSMRKIQKMQPKMEAIKARYKKHRSDPEQRQKMNAEVMKLYQQEGVNPAGGCLPMLIQFPIFYGFYEMLSHAIELRGAEFGLWIHDLSAKDPTYILPILMTVAMFIQQVITPTTADPQQRRMFLIMPIVFGWIFKEFPSGLTLYWLVQNILTIIQQMITNKYWKDHPAAVQNGQQEDRAWRSDSKEKISRTH